MTQINHNTLMWSAIYTAMTADYSNCKTKEERERAEQQKTKEEYKRLCDKFGLK